MYNRFGISGRFLVWPLVQHNNVYNREPQTTYTKSPSASALISNMAAARLHTPGSVRGKSVQYFRSYNNPRKFESTRRALFDPFMVCLPRYERLKTSALLQFSMNSVQTTYTLLSSSKLRPEVLLLYRGAVKLSQPRPETRQSVYQVFTAPNLVAIYFPVRPWNRFLGTRFVFENSQRLSQKRFHRSCF